METILTLAGAGARQLLTTLLDAATVTWTWLAAQPTWVVAILMLGAKAIIVTGFVQARRRRRLERVTGSRARATAGRTRVTPKATVASRAARTTPRRTPFTPAVTASQARELVVHGVPAIEISRRTGLARDAVSLLLSQAGRRDRQGRPGPAGLSPFGSRTGRFTSGRPDGLTHFGTMA